MGGQQYPEGAAGFRVCFVGGGEQGAKAHLAGRYLNILAGFVASNH